MLIFSSQYVYRADGNKSMWQTCPTGTEENNINPNGLKFLTKRRACSPKSPIRCMSSRGCRCVPAHQYGHSRKGTWNEMGTKRKRRSFSFREDSAASDSRKITGKISLANEIQRAERTTQQAIRKTSQVTRFIRYIGSNVRRRATTLFHWIDIEI